MDDLKKNLHLVVLGGGILLGAILLVAGIMVRGGAEDELDERQSRLTGAANPPTQGDLAAAQQARTNFEESMTRAEATLRTGGSLLADFNPAMSQSDFRNQVSSRLGPLRSRFARMAEIQRSAGLPEPVSDREIVPDRSESDSDIFNEIETRMGSAAQAQVRSFWIELRIMEELAAVCESLIDAGADAGMGLRLVRITFDNFDDGGTARDRNRRPWMTMNWQMELRCAPSLALLIMEEMTVPTELTTGTGPGARKAFPNQLRTFAVMTRARPTVAGFNISKEFKTSRKWDPDLDAGSDEGSRRIEQVRQELENLEILQPVSAEYRFTAATLNPEWQPIQPES